MMLLAAIDWHTYFFMLFALLACAFAVGVVFTANVVRMAFYLVMSLGSTAGLFFLAGAEFVGAMQLMIYVGGTLVLLIFGVMLTAQSRFVSMKPKSDEWILTAAVGGAFLLMLLYVAFSVPDWTQPNPNVADVGLAETKLAAPIGLALTGIRLDGGSGYLFPFLIVSVHLLVVLIGAAYLARTKRRADSSE
jgi:NADH:ubiquinone oxidoreductase subunit 6 (subunit J)